MLTVVSKCFVISKFNFLIFSCSSLCYGHCRHNCSLRNWNQPIALVYACGGLKHRWLLSTINKRSQLTVDWLLLFSGLRLLCRTIYVVIMSIARVVFYNQYKHSQSKTYLDGQWTDAINPTNDVNTDFCSLVCFLLMLFVLFCFYFCFEFICFVGNFVLFGAVSVVVRFGWK